MEFSLVLLLVVLIAFLYSAVGHGGASGYLALMVLLGYSPIYLKSTALLLNIVVSGIAFYQFYRAGFFRKDLFLPFTFLSIPMAYLGSRLPLSEAHFKIILGFCLLISIGRILLMNAGDFSRGNTKVPIWAALIIGAVIGLISGMIGIGGGVLLSPLLLLFKWANLKESAAIAAPFILVNSLAGMAGLWSIGITFSPDMIAMVVAASVGGIIGGIFGTKGNSLILKYILSAVMLIAAAKLFL